MLHHNFVKKKSLRATGLIAAVAMLGACGNGINGVYVGDYPDGMFSDTDLEIQLDGNEAVFYLPGKAERLYGTTYEVMRIDAEDYDEKLGVRFRRQLEARVNDKDNTILLIDPSSGSVTFAFEFVEDQHGRALRCAYCFDGVSGVYRERS